MVDAVESGYTARALIGQNKAVLRSPAGLSRVSHPQVCPCTSVHVYIGRNKDLCYCSKQSVCITNVLEENLYIMRNKTNLVGKKQNRVRCVKYYAKAPGAKDGLYQVLHTNTIPNTILDKNC